MRATVEAPAVHRSKVEVRVLGTSVTLHEHIRKQAEKDLGIKLRYMIHEGLAVPRKGVMDPQSYDVFDEWFHSIDFLWPARALQPIDVGRISRWNEINSFARAGRIGRRHYSGEGAAPIDRLYVQQDGSLGRKPSSRISALPLTHNADSFVYLDDRLPRSLLERGESWSWLLAPEVAGRVALQADAAIGAIDAALAVQSSGLMSFRDLGNLSVEEIDGLIDILIEYKRRGHFAGFWTSFAEAAQLMISNRVVIQSIWEPATLALSKAGLKFKLASPREGYRTWLHGLSLSRTTTGRTLDAAYEYLNWWLGGWVGATMARQGFYISNPERSREFMTEDEWAYWYDGKITSTDLPGPLGERLVTAGGRRDGGSWQSRMSRIAVFDSVMDEHNYLIRRWTEFMRA